MSYGSVLFGMNVAVYDDVTVVSCIGCALAVLWYTININTSNGPLLGISGIYPLYLQDIIVKLKITHILFV